MEFRNRIGIVITILADPKRTVHLTVNPIKDQYTRWANKAAKAQKEKEFGTEVGRESAVEAHNKTNGTLKKRKKQRTALGVVFANLQIPTNTIVYTHTHTCTRVDYFSNMPATALGFDLMYLLAAGLIIGAIKVRDHFAAVAAYWTIGND